jgi:iron complex outermembrane receptor protein/vitamin B12 transporter
MIGYAERAVDLALVGYVTGKQDDSTFLSDEFFGSSMLLPNHNLNAGYAKIDLSGGYRFAPTLRWYVSIENLFGSDYQAAAGFPALPRTFRTGVTINVGGDRRP